MKKNLRIIFSQLMVLASLLLFNGANAQQFRVVGYVPNWIDVNTFANNLDYSKLTHINYCFQNPDASGNLVEANTGLTNLVTKAHAANVKVLISLGGGAASENATTRGNYFNLINSTNRAAFVQKIVAYVNSYSLDGVDVDLEGPAINNDYDGFVVALANALQPNGKLVTAAVKHDYGDPSKVNVALTKFDFINIMAYDKVGSWDATPGQHSSYSYATGMVDYWKNRGVAYSKMSLGLPFYGYGWNSNPGNWSYSSILASFPGVQNSDQAGNIIYFNGIPTIKSKTTYACNTGLGGVMIWELTNDVSGQYSLMKAIHDALGACGAIPAVSITSPATNSTYNAPASVTFNATASVSSGSITKVDFYSGSTLLGTDNSSPYSFSWNNISAGVYNVTAVATSSSGTSATSAIVTIKVKGPHGGTAWPIPGKIEAEDYDEGGQGVSYNDNTAGNSGAADRTEDVDIEPLAGGGYNLAYTAAGEWVNYTVNVAATGQYNFQVRIATTTTGKSFHIKMDGTNVTGAINLPNTGAWGTYQIVTVNNIALTQGLHTMQVYMDMDGFNLDYVNVVALPAPSITFNNTTKTYGDANFNVNATSNSTGAITYSITAGSQYASITSGGQVTIKGAGAVTIQASQAAAGGYNAGTATSTLTINKAALTITADNKSKVYNTANPALTMSYSGLVYSEASSVLTSQPSISTTALANSKVGTYPIELNGGTAANYTITLKNGTLTVTKATPTLAYTGATSGNLGASINLTATSNSTGAISYSVSNGTGIATVNGSTLNLTQSGNVSLTISVAASTNYNAASIQQTITINSLGSPTIVFNNLTKTYGDANFNVNATSNSTGAITYSITAGSQYASITSGGQVTIKGAGMVTIQASQAAAGGYNAGTATSTLTINKAALTITADNKSKVYNTANPALTMSYSGLVYSETSSVLTSQPSISTTALANSNVGTYPIELNGGTAANYTITLKNGTLTVTKATPTLAYTGATSGNQGASINLTATSNSTGAISYSVSNGTGTATVNGSTLNLTQSGNVSLTISVGASTNYNAASVQQTITINSLGSPTIVFNNVTKTYGDANFNVNATSNSTGAITYSITAGSEYATITSGGQVTIKGAGTVTLLASQAANGGFSAGTKSATLTINKATLTIKADNKSKVYNTANPTLTMSYSGFVYSESETVLTSQPSISTTALANSNVGTYPIELNGGTAANYIISLVNGTLIVTKESNSDFTYTGVTSGNVNETITLSGTSSSTGNITYAIIDGGTGNASLSGNQLTLVSEGVVTIQITINGDDNHETQIITQEITINKNTTTGINNALLSNAQLNVYPNPIQDMAQIEIEVSENCNGILVLCDMNGKVLQIVAEGMISKQANYRIPMDEYSSGMYLVKLATDKGMLVKKISK